MAPNEGILKLGLHKKWCDAHNVDIMEFFIKLYAPSPHHLEPMGNKKNFHISARKKNVGLVEPNVVAEDVLSLTNGTESNSWVPII